MSTLAHPTGPTWVATHRALAVALMAALLAALFVVAVMVLTSPAADPIPRPAAPTVFDDDPGSGTVCRPERAPLPQPC